MISIRSHRTALLAAALALGWSVREAQFASAQGKRVASLTMNAAEVQMGDHTNAGKSAGKAGVYFQGETAGAKTLQVGRFLLEPGATPHAPHQHVDEEVLIVSRGSGEVFCNGKTVPVKAGAVMFADTNVSHGITNTGDRPLEFYWVKYVPGR